MARKRKLTPAMTAKLVKALKSGITASAACSIVGIANKTYYEWLKKGREGNGDIYEKFLIAIEKANAEAEKAMLDIITNHSVKHWQAAAWVLERRFRDRWAKDVPLEKDDDQDDNIDESFL